MIPQSTLIFEPLKGQVLVQVDRRETFAANFELLFPPKQQPFYADCDDSNQLDTWNFKYVMQNFAFDTVLSLENESKQRNQPKFSRHISISVLESQNARFVHFDGQTPVGSHPVINVCLFACANTAFNTFQLEIGFIGCVDVLFYF